MVTCMCGVGCVCGVCDCLIQWVCVCVYTHITHVSSKVPKLIHVCNLSECCKVGTNKVCLVSLFDNMEDPVLQRLATATILS